MAKRSKTSKKSPATPATQAAADLRTIAHARYVADLRDGRRQRAVTFTDRKKQAAKRACRDWRAA